MLSVVPLAPSSLKEYCTMKFSFVMLRRIDAAVHIGLHLGSLQYAVDDLPFSLANAPIFGERLIEIIRDQKFAARGHQRLGDRHVGRRRWLYETRNDNQRDQRCRQFHAMPFRGRVNPEMSFGSPLQDAARCLVYWPGIHIVEPTPPHAGGAGTIRALAILGHGRQRFLHFR